MVKVSNSKSWYYLAITVAVAILVTVLVMSMLTFQPTHNTKTTPSQTASLKVIIRTINDYNTNATSSNAVLLTVNGTRVNNDTANTFNVGTYFVNETSAGSYVESYGGECASDGLVTLDLGDDKTCIITNYNPLGSLKLKIAFLPASFTSAAYQSDKFGNHVKFYAFYAKYNNTPVGVDVTTDLDKLTSVVPQKGHSSYIDTFSKRIKGMLPNALLSEINETDVNEGRIFLKDGSNAFDMLILFHEEYVTQQMYDNFKHFVANGGTLIIIDANFFYAEVKYESDKNTVTLLKGHGWEFDGKAAKRGVYERWFYDTKEWVGSNYWGRAVDRHDIIFANNPFNYTHSEENYVNNPNDVIILDYKVKDPRKVQQDTIATYELKYGKGKSIVTGLTAERLYKNEKFLKFLIPS